MTITPADFPAATIPLDIPEDPQSPFGVIALPNPAIPVTNRGINRAYAAMLHHYRVPADASQRDKCQGRFIFGSPAESVQMASSLLP
jgi:hypothetical protein